MTADEIWNELSSELSKWFHDPDLEALRICLAALGSHYYHSEKPVWVLLIGDSGSGKSEIVASSVSTLPESWIIGDLTPKSFLSAWQKSKDNSMLFTQTVPIMSQPGRQAGIWISKDFTTIFSLHHDDRARIMASLREIWDGRFARKTGVGPMLDWSGKITLLAMATPEVEAHWSAFRGLGERFLGLRWRSPPDRLAAMRKARSQFGHEIQIAGELRRLVNQLLDPSRFASVTMPEPELLDSIDALADVVALLRVHVPRASENSRAIVRIPDPEFPTRISMGLYQVLRTHAAIFGRTLPGTDDLAVSYRLAEDSIPHVRHKILTQVPHSGDEISQGDVLRKSEIPRTTLQREIENLIALRVLVESTDSFSSDWSMTAVRLHPTFRTKLQAAGFRVQRLAKVFGIV